VTTVATTLLRLAGLVQADGTLDDRRGLVLRRLHRLSNRLPPFRERHVRVLHLILLKKFRRPPVKRSIHASFCQRHDRLIQALHPC